MTSARSRAAAAWRWRRGRVRCQRPRREGGAQHLGSAQYPPLTPPTCSKVGRKMGCLGFMVVCECKLTGNTSGMPPLTALLPSSTAPSLSQSFSLPLASFQLRTVAPCSRISTVSPVGSAALTRPSSMSTVGWAWDCCVAARAEGLLGRSTIVAISSVLVYV